MKLYQFFQIYWCFDKKIEKNTDTAVNEKKYWEHLHFVL